MSLVWIMGTERLFWLFCSVFHRLIHCQFCSFQAIAVFGEDPREYKVLTKEFIGDEDGNVVALTTVEVDLVDGRLQEVAGSERHWPCDMVILAMVSVILFGRIDSFFLICRDL